MGASQVGVSGGMGVGLSPEGHILLIQGKKVLTITIDQARWLSFVALPTAVHRVRAGDLPEPEPTGQIPGQLAID